MKSVLIGSGPFAVILLAFAAMPASAHNLDRVHPASRWASSVERRIDVNLDYPAAVRLREPRSAEVAFSVGADGRLGEPVVTRSTGVAVLDEAAVEAVRRTASVGAPPASLTGRPITYRATFQAPTVRPGR